MADVPFTVFMFLGFLLAVECLYFISKTPGRPWATYILMTWVLLVNFFSFTDSVIWRGPDPSVWWDGKGYCDIVSRIKTEFPIGVCGAAIGISRFLAEATHPNPKQVDLRYNRMKRNIIDVVLGVALPLINAALRILVEPSRYYVMGVNGCTSITRTAWPAIPIYFLWVPLMTLVSAIYACTFPINVTNIGIIVYHWHLRRQARRNDWAQGINTGLSSTDFFRLVFTVMTLVLLYFPLSLFRLIQYLKINQSPYSWDSIHGPLWGIIVKEVVPSADWTLWTYFGLAFSSFLLFGIPRNAKPHFQRCVEVMYNRFPKKMQDKLPAMRRVAEKSKEQRRERSLHLSTNDDRATISTEPYYRVRV